MANSEDVTDATFRTKDYWIVENVQYTEASFRLKKCAQIIKSFAGSRQSSLLDVGCGPAALATLMPENISYYGIDIAIHRPAVFLKEVDVAHEKIAFDDMRFDFVTAMGFFEYMGHQQKQKLEEIRAILKPGGKFIMSYINFGHFRHLVWPNYNNVQSIAEMRAGLSQVFDVDRSFPASHHWRQKQPGKNSLRALQMRVNFNIPLFSPLLAVEYLFICTHRAGSKPRQA